MKEILTFWLWLAIFFLEFGNSGLAQTPDWKWQSPLPQGNTLNDVQFVDSETGWAVGENGTILKTRNSGQSWQIQTSGTTKELQSVQFTGAQTGWAVGGNGTILRTENSGQSWQSQNSGTTVTLRSVFFIDGQIGWAVGDSCIILKTTNGGTNWQKQTTGTTTLGHTSVYFIDSQTGWVVGYNGKIYKTSNAGQTWIPQTSGTTNQLNSVHFVNAQTGYVVGETGTIRKTTNGGQSWLAQSTGVLQNLGCINFTSELTGWILSYTSGVVLKTTNGGTNWQTLSSSAGNELLSLCFSDGQNGWVVGRYGTIRKTTDGAQSWLSVNNGTINNLSSVYFVDSQVGYAVGEGIILKTINGGQTWEDKTNGVNSNPFDVYFVDPQNGWICCWYGKIYRTTNGGESWQAQVSSSSSNYLFGIHFVDLQNGWAVGELGLVLKTTNGGQNWEYSQIGGVEMLSTVHFENELLGWAAGTEQHLPGFQAFGIILRTTDGGANWSVVHNGTLEGIASIFFSDPENGWAVGNNGLILASINGGDSWEQQNSGTTQDLYSVHFYDELHGLITGDSGTILRTSNGGQSWQVQNIDTKSLLVGASLMDSLHGWAVGYNGTILTTTTNNYTDPETPKTLIQGKLFEKTGIGCSTSPVPVSHRLVKATPGPYYGISNAGGNYDLRLPLGNSPINYTLSAVPFSSQAFQTNVVCPSNNIYNLNLDTLSDTLSGKDFGYQTPQCHHLDVQLASNRRRRCFRNSTSVSYSNQGSVTAPDAYILVEFSHWVRGISASASYTILNDSVWKFETGSVQAGMGGQFTITDSVICGNPDIRNLSQCTRATIFPPPNCPPPGSWNGADLAIYGSCDSGLVHLSIRNKGTGNMTDSTDFSVLMDSILVKSGKVKLAAGDSLIMVVQPQNTVVTLSVNQVANHPTEIFVTTTLEGCGNLSLSNPLASVNHFPKSQTARSKTHCLPILDSYDPNDKQVFPIGFTSNHVVKPDSEMEYLLRFQNTGSDTAYTVTVVDTLDTYLNVESLEIGAISHPCQTNVQTTKSGQTILRFRFDQINLPDSTTDEAKSQGFIQFRISPKPGLAMGTQVFNRADLYFDLNPAVRTNQTLTTFDELVFTNPSLDTNVQVVTASQPMVHQKNTVQVFPNPANETVTIEGQEDILKISLVDALGRALVVPASGPNRLDIRQLKSGMYWLKIQTREGVVMKKLIKN